MLHRLSMLGLPLYTKPNVQFAYTSDSSKSISRSFHDTGNIILRSYCSIVMVCILRASNTVKKTQLQYIIFWFYYVWHFRQCRRQYNNNSTEVRNAIGIGRLVLCFIYGYVGYGRGEGSTTVWTSGVKIFLP